VKKSILFFYHIPTGLFDLKNLTSYVIHSIRILDYFSEQNNSSGTLRFRICNTCEATSGLH